MNVSYQFVGDSKPILEKLLPIGDVPFCGNAVEIDGRKYRAVCIQYDVLKSGLRGTVFLAPSPLPAN